MKHFSLLWLKALIVLAFTALPGLLRAQTWQWATTTGPNSSGSSTITATTQDAAGNTIVAGYFNGTITLGATRLTSTGDDDLFVARLNSAGQWTQAAQAGGSTSFDQAYAVAVDASGTIIVGGTFFSSAVSFGSFNLTNARNTPNNYSGDLFVAYLSPAGQWTGVVQAGTNFAEYVTALAVDTNGDLVVGGSFTGNDVTLGATTLPGTGGGSGNGFVARLTPAGVWSHVVMAGTGFAVGSSIGALVLDGSGNPIIAGNFSRSLQLGTLTLTATGNSADAFVARLDKATDTWTLAAQLGSSDNDYATCLAFTPTGDLLVGGHFYGPGCGVGSATLLNSGAAGTSDGFVARLSPTGSWTQVAQIGGAGNDKVQGLAVDGGGTAVVTGSFLSSTATLGSLTLANANATGTTSDIFLAALSPAGTWQRALRLGSAGTDGGMALHRSSSGTFLLAGTISPPVSFGPFALTDGFTDAAFTARFTDFAPTATTAALPALACSLYPNPACTSAVFTLPAATALRSVLLLNSLGRTVRRQPLPAGATSAVLSITGLVPGLYIVRCGATTARLLVE